MPNSIKSFAGVTEDVSIVSNHRPISLLNPENKIFERLVFKHLYNHLHQNNLLSSLQYGFIPGGSTVSHLTYLYNTFCQALDVGKKVHVITFLSESDILIF